MDWNKGTVRQLSEWIEGANAAFKGTNDTLNGIVDVLFVMNQRLEALERENQKLRERNKAW